MDKEALLNIILNDLKEVETLVTSFQGKNEIAEAFVSLAERKLSHISEELTLLRTFPNTKEERSTNQSTTIEQPAKTNQSVNPELEQEAVQKTKTLEPEETLNQEQPSSNLQPQQSESVLNEKPILNNYDIEVKKEQNKEQPPSTLETEEITIAERKPVMPEAVEPTTPEPQIEHTSTTVSKNEDIKETPKETKILGESFLADKKSVNDIIASNKTDTKRTLIGKPVHDLTKGLGINDRFLFQRELFSGNSEMMSQTLQQLNEIPDFNSAVAFITSNFNWDFETETTQSFMNYIKRKF